MVVFLLSVCCKILTNARHCKKNSIIKLRNLSINYHQQQKYLGTKYCEINPPPGH